MMVDRMMRFRGAAGQAPIDIVGAGRSNVQQQPPPVSTGLPRTLPRPVLLPPTFFPFRGSRRLFSQLSASVSNAAATVVATVALLAQEVAVISDIEIGINAFTTTSAVTWTVRFNGSPIAWGPLSLIPRAATYAGDAWSNLGLEVPIGVNTIDVLATVGAADAATYVIGASITGWAWTPALEQAIREGRS